MWLAKREVRKGDPSSAARWLPRLVGHPSKRTAALMVDERALDRWMRMGDV